MNPATSALLSRTGNQWLAATARKFLEEHPEQEASVAVLVRLKAMSDALLAETLTAENVGEDDVRAVLELDGRVASAVRYLNTGYRVDDSLFTLADIAQLSDFESTRP